jgi:hypothetical protein
MSVLCLLAFAFRSGAGRRAKRLREAPRVVMKGGKLAIADIRFTFSFASELKAQGSRSPVADRSALASRT